MVGHSSQLLEQLIDKFLTSGRNKRYHPNTELNQLVEVKVDKTSSSSSSDNRENSSSNAEEASVTAEAGNTKIMDTSKEAESQLKMVTVRRGRRLLTLSTTSLLSTPALASGNGRPPLSVSLSYLVRS